MAKEEKNIEVSRPTHFLTPFDEMDRFFHKRIFLSFVANIS